MVCIALGDGVPRESKDRFVVDAAGVLPDGNGQHVSLLGQPQIRFSAARIDG